MYTTYHLSSAQEINIDIIEAIKVAFKSKPITITIEVDKKNNISEQTKKMLDSRLEEYLKNPNDVFDFDELLIELKNEI
jgi:cytidylate kinase